MEDRKFIFICGLHRSGTSLIHEILRSHPEISGFSGTSAREDEGQHLQTVYPTAWTFGGPGRFGFNDASFMDERHPLATDDNARKLFHEWSPYWDLEKRVLTEKSPPNLVRTRFFQRLFPSSSFLVILRHPIAVSYATKRINGSNIPALLEHSLRCYERFAEDLPHLNRVFIIRYEEFVARPQEILNGVYHWIGVESSAFEQEVRPGVNQRYFDMWRLDRSSFVKRVLYGFGRLPARFEARANAFGYSVEDPDALLPVPILGEHGPASLQ